MRFRLDITVSLFLYKLMYMLAILKIVLSEIRRNEIRKETQCVCVWVWVLICTLFHQLLFIRTIFNQLYSRFIWLILLLNVDIAIQYVKCMLHWINNCLLLLFITVIDHTLSTFCSNVLYYFCAQKSSFFIDRTIFVENQRLLLIKREKKPLLLWIFLWFYSLLALFSHLKNVLNTTQFSFRRWALWDANTTLFESNTLLADTYTNISQLFWKWFLKSTYSTADCSFDFLLFLASFAYVCDFSFFCVSIYLSVVVWLAIFSRRKCEIWFLGLIRN